MRFNVADLVKAPTGATRVHDADETLVASWPELDAELVAPLQGQLTFVRDHAGILVSGQLETRVAVPCARCLVRAEAPVLFDVSEHFRPTVTIPGGTPVLVDPDEEDEPETRIDEQHVLDLEPVVRQLLETALPLHALCREACAGLCPDCGVNRNEESCTCEPAPDPRWSALRAMIDET